MRAKWLPAVLALFMGCSQGQPPAPPSATTNPAVPPAAQGTAPAAPPPRAATSVPPLPPVAPLNAESKPSAAKAEPLNAKVKPLTQDELQQLLDVRLDDPLRGMIDQSANQPFGQFANMFLTFSYLTVQTSVGLMSPSKEVSKTPIVSPFPSGYKPKLKEFLDALALQTFSQWKYDPSSKYLKSNVPGQELVDHLAFFEFLPVKREHPFEISLAEGWKANDKGAWVMYVPPSFIVGMDIWQMGRYSSDDDAGGDFFDEVMKDISLAWMRRVGIQDQPQKFSTTKVGMYPAYFFDKIMDTRDGKQLHWRQWVFMVGDECYAVVSTIFTELDATIYPDIEKMLPTFQMKEKPAQP